MAENAHADTLPTGRSQTLGQCWDDLDLENKPIAKIEKS